MPTYYHLNPADYAVTFPASLDSVPVLIDRRTFLDDWIYWRLFAGILAVEQFLIDNKESIEA